MGKVEWRKQDWSKEDFGRKLPMVREIDDEMERGEDSSNI